MSSLREVMQESIAAETVKNFSSLKSYLFFFPQDSFSAFTAIRCSLLLKRIRN